MSIAILSNDDDILKHQARHWQTSYTINCLVYIITNRKKWFHKIFNEIQRNLSVSLTQYWTLSNINIAVLILISCLSEPCKNVCVVSGISLSSFKKELKMRTV